MELKENIATGVIQSSLYLTLENQNFNPELALNLSEVYAWQIDFYRIQKGDKFKVIYEEKFLEGQSIGIGRIISAVFNHKGEDYYSFYFDQDENDNYFDENGNCLRREFLRSPIKFSRISSGFSRRRFHPVLKRYKAHLGVDFAAPTGTPVRAIGNGTVLEARYKGGNGNYVKIKHNSTYMSGYLHLSKFGKGIKSGAKVEQGQIIGYVGTTGLSSGPHLDLRFWKNGALINYLNVKFPPARPINEKYKEKFSVIKDTYMEKLMKENYETETDSTFIAHP